ncbi:hypothetical protein JK182_03935 [Acetobacter okinawensis]|uniref:hypothetical protein n=1 Tax=Acetobacter okinawensis TaxID=1076594 RepID=UPI001BABC081|nr:hypothetical protein [Acetobacter okinawensis]MBS0987840.1 hypothetical protein [Acetobacter okinawensis]
MSEKPTTLSPNTAGHSRRAFWRIGRGRSGGSLGCAGIARRAIALGHPVLIADGDINNPMLSRLYPTTSLHGVERPTSATLETSKVWLADILAQALQREASVIIDMGGGDRVSEELAEESNLGEFLSVSGLQPTYGYFTGPERDDFEHVYRIWNSGVFKGGQSVLILNSGLVRTHNSAVDPFAWLRKDPRYQEMASQGVKIIDMPALTCMKHIEGAGLTVFDAIDGKPCSDGHPLNLLWVHMAKEWYNKLVTAFESEGGKKWLP